MLGQDPDLFDKVLEQAAEILFTKGLEKDMEFEADKVGSEYAYRVGYRPEGLKNFLSVLGKNLPAQGSALASTHPNPQDRVIRLSGIMADFESDQQSRILQAEFKNAVQGQL